MSDTEKRIIITGPSDDGYTVRICTAADPDGEERPATEADLQRARERGWTVEDLRPAEALTPARSDVSDPPSTSYSDDPAADPEFAPPPVDRADLARRLRQAADALGGTSALSQNLDVRLSWLRESIASPDSTPDTTAANFDAALTAMGFPPAPPSEPAEEPAPSDTSDVPDPSYPPAPASPEIRRIAPGDIITDGGTQARADMSDETVGEYAAEMRAGVVFPPVVVFEDEEGNLWLAAGFHRVSAALRAGLLAITAEVRTGTRRDAILYSCGENTEHGLRRTRADRRNAVRMVLEDEEWRGWSAERIAQVCRVGGDLVLAMKREMGLTSVNGGDKVCYTTRQGTVATMNTAGMARTPEPPTEPAPRTEGEQAPASYPSERAPAPAHAAPPLPMPRSEDDHTPTLSVKRFAAALYDALQACAHATRADAPPQREKAVKAIIAQHIQDAVDAAREGRLS